MAGILISTGDFPEVLSQAILVGRFLVGRLGVVGKPAALAGLGQDKYDIA